MNDVWVCDNCLRASCWLGIFMCDESDVAGVIRQSKKKCMSLGREHSDYYNNPEVEVEPDDTRERL